MFSILYTNPAAYAQFVDLFVDLDAATSDDCESAARNLLTLYESHEGNADEITGEILSIFSTDAAVVLRNTEKLAPVLDALHARGLVDREFITLSLSLAGLTAISEIAGTVKELTEKVDAAVRSERLKKAYMFELLIRLGLVGFTQLPADRVRKLTQRVKDIDPNELEKIAARGFTLLPSR